MADHKSNTRYQRPKTVLFSYYSDGSYHLFNPTKTIYDPKDPKNRKTLLDLHFELVAARNSPSVFITNESGNRIDEKGNAYDFKGKLIKPRS